MCIRDSIRACRELTGRGVRKISPEQVKAMLHGNAQEEMEESMESPVPVSYTHLDVYKRQVP